MGAARAVFRRGASFERTGVSRAREGARKARTMKYAREFITSTVVGGLFIVVPVYLAVLLLLKGMKSVGEPGAATRSAGP